MIELTEYGGMAPRIDPRMLADKLATLARNVRFDRGLLAPGGFRLVPSADYPDDQLAGGATRAAVRLFEDGTRLALSDPRGADAFVSFVAPADTWGRVYYMTDAGPSFTTADLYAAGGLTIDPITYRLGVPAPAAGPSVPPSAVSVADPADGAEPDEVDVAWVFSYVDRYGHEGPLSSPTRRVALAYNAGFSATLGFSEPLPTRVNFDGGLRRVYRATFDGESSVWQFVADVPITESSYTDEMALGEESEQSVSDEWDPPPAIQQMVAVANSFAAGYFEHTLCYSEARLPHAWPTRYQYPLKYQPVKLLATNNGLLVATTGKPYWAQGTDPGSATPVELPGNAPCIAPASVVDMGDYAIYASAEGLVAAAPGEVRLITGELIDRGQFEALVGPDCEAFAYDGRYVFSTRDDRWLGLDPTAQDGFVEYDFGIPPSALEAVTFSVRDHQHYLAQADGTIRVVDFGGEPAGAEWRSKVFTTPATSFTAVRVRADQYPIELGLWMRYDTTPAREVTLAIADGEIRRLPAGVATQWQFTLRPPAGGRIQSLDVMESVSEVAHGQA